MTVQEPPPSKISSGKTDPVQFKGFFKQGPFCFKMRILQAVFSS